MPITLGGVQIPDHGDLIWSDERDWSPLVQSVERGFGGVAILDTRQILSARPMTLSGGESWAWSSRANLDALRDLLAPAGSTHTLTLDDGRQYRVTARIDQGVAVACRPVPVVADSGLADGGSGELWIVDAVRLWVLPDASGSMSGGVVSGLVGLPDPATLPNGSHLQVMLGQWYVTITAGLAPVSALPSSGLLPDPATLPDGATMQVSGAQWVVETAPGVWTPVVGLSRTAGLPSPTGHLDGALIEVADGAWTVAA